MVVGWGMTAWGWVWMALMMGGGTLLLILLVMLVLRASSPASRGEPREDPKEILASRFARGEIDEAEYRRRLTALQS